MTFAEVMALAQFEYETRSRSKYDWSKLPPDEQWDALAREFNEALEAFVTGQVDGPHGEKAEIIHLIVVAARRVMELSKESTDGKDAHTTCPLPTPALPRTGSIRGGVVQEMPKTGAAETVLAGALLPEQA